MGTCCDAFDKHWIIFPSMWHIPRLSQGRTQGRPKCALSWLQKLTHVPLAMPHPSCLNCDQFVYHIHRVSLCVLFGVSSSAVDFTDNTRLQNVSFETLNSLTRSPRKRYMSGILCLDQHRTFTLDVRVHTSNVFFLLVIQVVKVCKYVCIQVCRLVLVWTCRPTCRIVMTVVITIVILTFCRFIYQLKHVSDVEAFVSSYFYLSRIMLSSQSMFSFNDFICVLCDCIPCFIFDVQSLQFLSKLCSLFTDKICILTLYIQCCN